MATSEDNNKRIAKNTVYLYIRMGFLMLISVFTSRVVLDKLGVEDFGIYNVVGGVSAMFGFFSSSLSNASQRFFSIELERNNIRRLNSIFNQHLILYLCIVAVVAILAETVGLWFVKNKLIIPAERMAAAVRVYHFTVASLCLSLTGIVFHSCIIAHEDMNVYSYIGVLEGVMKLVLVYMISITSGDRLVFWGFLLLMIMLTVQSCYMIHCFRNYKECRLRLIWDKSIIRETGSIMGWNVVGTAVYAINDSGVNVLLNLFFGPIVNAARAVSMQVNGAINNFSSNFFTSIRPQLMKSYASGNTSYMMYLFYNSTRYSFYLLWVICLPIMFSINEILDIWLVEVPPHTGVFTVWILICSMIGSMNNPIWALVLATGEMKEYTIVGNAVLLSIFPISYVLLKLGFEAEYVFVIKVVVQAVYTVVVLYIIKKYIPLQLGEYLRKVIIPIAKSIVLSLMVAYMLYCVFPKNVTGTISYCAITFVLTVVVILAVGVTPHERSKVFDIIGKKLKSRRR